jgi:hypothetical protein
MNIARLINTALICLTLLAFLAQLIIEFSTDNIATACIILASSVSTLLYLRWSKALDTHPLSSFTLFGFCVTSQLGALFAQSVAWTAVSANLRQPLVTFPMLAIYLTTALIAHAFYRVIFSSPKQSLVRHTLQSLGVYNTPSPLNLWIMGGLGAFFLLLSRLSPVANALSFFAWAPFLIPIYLNESGLNYGSSSKNYLLLVTYAVFIALMAMAFNARGMMLSGLMTVALLFLLVGMRSSKPFNTSMIIKFGLFGLFAAAVSWPASNMITAMEVARIDRGKISAPEMVKNTLENFQSPEKLDMYRKQRLARTLASSYDEYYVDNDMLGRFVITKFHDNAIYYAGKISDKGADEIMKITNDFFLTTLPQPFLDALKVDVDKENMGFSMGDVLAHFAVATPLSGERTGSIFGQGWVLFGYLFPVIYFAMCLILFASLDIFSLRTTTGTITLSVIGMLNTWPTFLFGITADSLQHLFLSVVRGIPQNVILYAVIFYISKLLSKLLLNMVSGKRSVTIEK